jgi:hypothetical protein
VSSMIDLHFDYHDIKIRAEDILKTGFSIRYSLYEYLIMSFGLTNVLAYFMYLMNYVFMLELDKSVMIFINDILVSSKNRKNIARVLYLGPPGTAHKSGYDQFPLAANGHGTMHPIPDMAPLLLAEEEVPPT